MYPKQPQQGPPAPTGAFGPAVFHSIPLVHAETPKANPEPHGKHSVSPSCSKWRATGVVPEVSDRAIDVTHPRRQRNLGRFCGIPPTEQPHVVPCARYEPQSGTVGMSAAV